MAIFQRRLVLVTPNGERLAFAREVTLAQTLSLTRLSLGRFIARRASHDIRPRTAGTRAMKFH